MRVQVLVLLAAAALLYGQKPKDNPGDWPMYTRDLAGTRYSPLKQINTGNVSKLTEAWTYKLSAAAPAAAAAAAEPAAGGGDFAGAAAGRGGAGRGGNGANPEATPIVVNGLMYLPAGRRVIALDPESGKEVWTAQLPSATTARGVAFWPGDANNPPRILLTAGTNLIALNANSGKVDPGFGKEGIVDITVPWNGVPAIFKNVVMLGATVGEIPIGPPGDSRAYDARTGAKLWDFHSIPRPGEIGFGSWEKDSWKGFSGVNVWGWYLTADEERGILYMPFGSPAGNYYGGDRPGNGLFGNSIVAVDANTGKYLWHFQTVHHDLWDSDLPPAPSLIDIVVKGKKIPVLAQIGKTGWMFILDRVTGKPVFGVEERPVRKGDVPGEWYSPTQPFPLKPPPLALVSFSKEDIVTAADTTPEHAAACQDLYTKEGGLYNDGPFSPWPYHEAGTPPKSAIQFPGMTGGVNWGGTATDPKSGYVFMQTHDASLVGWMEKTRPGAYYGRGTDGSNLPFDRGSIVGPGPYHSFSVAMKDKDGNTIGT